MQSTLTGPKWIPPAEGTLDACLEGAAQNPDFPWLVFRTGSLSTTLTFGGALELARRWAAAIAPFAARGDRVAICLPNGADFVGALFGAFRLGVVAVPLPWPVSEPDPERLLAASLSQISRARAKAVITTAAVGAGAKWPVPVLSKPSDAPHLGEAVAQGGDAAFIQFTSGSTSTPRGAVITHGAGVACAANMAQALELSDKERGVSWLPFFHDMGLVGVLFTSLRSRFTVQVMRPGEFLLRPRRWLEVITEVKATLTSGPNFGYALAARRVNDLTGLDLSSVRSALNGSEPVHRTTLEAMKAKFGPVGLSPKAQRPVYGLAEATLGVAFAPLDDGSPDLVLEGRTLPSVGAPLAGVEVRIGDGQGPAGEPGRIWVKSPCLMQGYFEDPEQTAQVLQGCWLDTGDLGVVRGGALYVTGREKELIVKAGQKFHPYEIEAVVNECLDSPPNGVAAFSVPDAAQGTEALVVVAELRRVSQDPGLVDLVRGKLIDALGVRADRVELVPAGSLPRTTSGKLKREAVRRAWGAL